MVHASYLAPDAPLGACNEAAHIAAYVRPHEGIECELAEVLHAYMASQQLRLSRSTAQQETATVIKAATAATMANDVSMQPVLAAQLALLAAAAPHERRPQLTLPQLRFEASAALVRLCVLSSQYFIMGEMLQLEAGRQPESRLGPTLSGLSGEACKLANTMQRLEPSNPRTLLALAQAAELAPGGRLRALRLYLLMHSLAEQRWGSPYWAAQGAQRAQQQLAACGDKERRHPEFQRMAAATAEAAQRGTRALRRCRRVLPALWLLHLEAAGVQESEAQPPTASSGSRGAANGRGAGSLQRWIEECPLVDSTVCSGCGNAALGLQLQAGTLLQVSGGWAGARGGRPDDRGGSRLASAAGRP